MNGTENSDRLKKDELIEIVSDLDKKMNQLIEMVRELNKNVSCLSNQVASLQRAETMKSLRSLGSYEQNSLSAENRMSHLPGYEQDSTSVTYEERSINRK